MIHIQPWETFFGGKVKGAAKQLGLATKGKRNVEIVCDLMSGACNPTEVKRLLKTFGPKRVLTCDRLHAKVWLVDGAAVVGSSNASSNGLGEEGAEASGLIEANVIVRDPNIVDELDRWYEGNVRKLAKKISREALKVAEKRWTARRIHRPAPGDRYPESKETVLQGLRKQPAEWKDRNVHVWVFQSDEPSKSAKKTLKKERKARMNNRLDFWENVERSDELPGAYVLEFHSDNKKISFEGLWRIPADEPFVKVPADKPSVEDRKKNILLAMPVTPRELWGHPLGDRKVWREAAKDAADKSPERQWGGKLDKFARKFL